MLPRLIFFKLELIEASSERALDGFALRLVLDVQSVAEPELLVQHFFRAGGFLRRNRFRCPGGVGMLRPQGDEIDPFEVRCAPAFDFEPMVTPGLSPPAGCEGVELAEPMVQEALRVVAHERTG